MSLEAAAERPAGYEVSVGTIAWLAAAALFIAMRIAGLASIPVGGAELDHLSGAWQAHVGNEDSRFVPTLFQAMTAWLFSTADSEVAPRALAVLASASVPLALYRLRGLLGEAGAMAALVLLAVDPTSILFGSTAWASAFDVPIVLWLLVLMREVARPPWLLAVAGFGVATAGAVVLPVVLAFAVARLWRQRYPSGGDLLWAGGGVLLGWIIAATSFGFGLKDPVLPPVLAFAQGFESTWSNESTSYLALLYSAPLMALGVAAAAYRAFVCWSDQEWPEDTVALLLAFALSLTWVVLSGGSHDPVPLAALAVPAALLLGREVPAVFAALQGVRWAHAAPALAGVLAGALIAEAYVVDWARFDRVGSDRDKLIVAGVVIAAIACAGLLASNRRTVAAIFIPVGVAAALPMLAGASGIAFGGANEPLPSPVSSLQGREVRDIAIEARTQQGGLIVIHSDFGDAATWPFRDSGDVVFASRVPPDATVLVWPTSEAAPDGYSVLEGNWSLLERRNGPDGGFLDYLRWLTNRNSLLNTIEPVAVYLRTAP